MPWSTPSTTTPRLAVSERRRALFLTAEVEKRQGRSDQHRGERGLRKVGQE
jgi:hypothetical protein